MSAEKQRMKTRSLQSAATRAFFQAGRLVHRPWTQLVHGYVYARWPFGYIGAAIAEKRGLRWLRVLFAPFLLRALRPQKWAEEYHGKVMPTQQAIRLVTIKEDIALPQPEDAIPFQTARDLILQNPQTIAVLDCPCRMARANPCLPLDVCLIVGDPFASFILEHHPEHARAISQDEAVEILQAEAQRGHVHHAFFKRAMLNRFYAICNCCACCCGAMHAQRSGTPMLIASGYLAQVDRAACASCGQCAQACPFGAISVAEQASVNPDACMGCGVCVNTCPNKAISLVLGINGLRPLALAQDSVSGS